ncbi:hypothetical protein IV102_16200 [bacterium]|nr:hypothetical protein [bacterium]
MICLACGSEQSNQLPACSGCGHKFAVFPPFVRCNHVAQLQSALRECQQGTTSWEQFGDIYARFLELGLHFQQRWRSGPEASLVSSLAPALKEPFQSGVAELDQALGLLEEALVCLDQALETGESEGLGQADTLLTDFFKVGCGGCAILMEELDKSELQEPRGTMLDVRGL